MSTAHGGHADVTERLHQNTREMEVGQAPKQGVLPDRPPNSQTSGQNTIASKGAAGKAPRNKQTMDYVLRTGFAGGLAGCAV